MTALAHIADGDTGLSVRNKLNFLIDQYNTPVAFPTGGGTPGSVLFVGAGGNLSQANIASKTSLNRDLQSRLLVKQVMASPPTIAFTTTNPIVSPKTWPPITSNSGANPAVNTQFMAVSGAFNPTMRSAAFPQYANINWQSVNYGSGFSSNVQRLVFQYRGSRLEVGVYGVTGFVMAKINGAYVSLTPQTVPNDGNFYYWDFSFAAADTYEIEIIGSNLNFHGLYTSATDTITPGPLRGPKTVIISDSYGEGTGATYSAISEMWFRAMDELGWNNYWLDATGGTGLLANDGGLRPNYYDRFIGDVVPLAPELIIVQMSVNDDTFTNTQIANQVTAFMTQAKAQLPNAVVMFTGEFLRSGATSAGSGPFLRTAAVKAAALAAGALFADTNTTPLQATALTNTLGANATTPTTTLTVNSQPLVGAHYAFADGTRILVKSVSGSGPWTVTTDAGGIQASQISGAVMTQVGDSPITGNGNAGAPNGSGNADIMILADGVHPTQAGHDMWGEILAKQILLAMRS